MELLRRTRAARSRRRRARTCSSTPRRRWPSWPARASRSTATPGVTRGRVRVAATTVDAPRLPEALAVFHRAASGPAGGAAPRAGRRGARARRGRQRGRRRRAASTGTRRPAWRRGARRRADVRDAARGRPARRRRPVALAALPSARSSSPSRAAALREAVVAACQRAGFSPVPLFEISDPLTVRHLVHAGLGVGVAPAAWFESPGPAVAASPLAGEALRHRVGALTAGGGPSARRRAAARRATRRLRAPGRALRRACPWGARRRAARAGARRGRG